MALEKYGLNLKEQLHRNQYLDLLYKCQGLPFTIEKITESINFLCKYLSDDWLIVYLGIYQAGGIGVRVTPTRSISFDFLHDIIPLGNNLRILEGMNNFHRLIVKLNTNSYERIGTIVEISCAFPLESIQSFTIFASLQQVP